jgi:hypothetical protein
MALAATVISAVEQREFSYRSLANTMGGAAHAKRIPRYASYS